MNRKHIRNFAGAASRSLRCFAIVSALIALTLAAAGCGSGGDTSSSALPVGPATAQPAKAATPPPTAEPQPSPTQAPASAPMPSPTPPPTATPQPVPTQEARSEPTQEASTPTATAVAQSELPSECLATGTLTDSRLILACSNDAMARLRTVRIDSEFNIGALLAGALPSDAQPPVIRMEIARVFPDTLEVITTSPEGETTRIILADSASYFYDEMSDVWVKSSLSEEETASMLMSLNMVERQMQQDLDDPAIVWSDAALSEDGAKYIISYETAGETQGMQLPPMELNLSIDTSSFLQDSASALIVDSEGMRHKLAGLRYSGHDEPLTIEPPAEYIEADASMLPPSASDGFGEDGANPEIISLSKSANDNVQLNISAPVTVVGEVSLYVINPSTGDGWQLPYIDGSSTNTLTFDAAAPDNPPLVGGESRIVGFSFDSPEADILAETGQPAILYFDEWTYPE